MGFRLPWRRQEDSSDFGKYGAQYCDEAIEKDRQEQEAEYKEWLEQDITLRGDAWMYWQQLPEEFEANAVREFENWAREGVQQVLEDSWLSPSEKQRLISRITEVKEMHIRDFRRMLNEAAEIVRKMTSN